MELRAGHHSGGRHGKRAGGALVATALLLTLAAAPAEAAPPGAAPATATAKPAGALHKAATAARVTLVTGDVATYSRDSAGHASVGLEFGPGRSSLTYRAYQENGGYYVIPGDAQSYVTAGLVDKNLFNVDYLAANGYADTATGQLPIIVQYGQKMAAPALGQKAATLPSGAQPMALQSINGAATRVDKKRTGAFWQAVRGTAATMASPAAPTRLGEGLTRVWLDAKVKATDDVSDAQIGAPVAWAAGADGTGAQVGIIDTGIDATHPDLAGKVTAAQNFVPAGEPGGGNAADTTDRFGHGTHVASIIAGTGAASSGRYEGVAPGAKLTIAKALNDSGSGANSTIIAAMQWQAATEHARVVSMSLGGDPTDGTDPLSQAVNDLTAQYGTLFVIAAGNSGPSSFTVAAPGAASTALTVGAVDKSDKLASFSSRGPRLGADFGLKPEITAPGVHIIAARAAGTSLGAGGAGDGPIDQNYTSASGTSMATPHVAAAAAILATKHPDWSADQLKAALVGTAKDVGYTPYEQGAGRLDLGRAVTQQVFADVSTVSAGFTDPYTGQALTRRVTYRNTGQTPATLALSVTLSRGSLTSVGTQPAPAGMASVSPASITIPAGGTASADLTIDPSTGDSGWYGGGLLATDGAANRLSVPIAFHKQARQETVRVRVVGDPAWSMTMLGALSAVRVNDTDPSLDGEPIGLLAGGWTATGTPNTVELNTRLAHGGKYFFDTQMMWWNKADRQIQYGYLLAPEVSADGAATVTFDARKLVKIQVNTPRPSEQVTMNYMSSRTTASGRVFMGGGVYSYPVVAPGGFWVSPTGAAPKVGTFSYLFDQIRIAPQVSLTIAGRTRLDLHPRYVTDRNDIVPKFTADRRLGLASEADLLAGRDVHDKLVYLAPVPLATLLSDMDLAAKAGAAGVVTNNYLSWVMYDSHYTSHMKVPLLWLDSAEAAQVAGALSTDTPRAEVRAQLDSPYEYKLVYYLHGAIPTKLTFNPSARDVASVDTTYHAQFTPPAGAWGNGSNFEEVDHTFAADQPLSIRAGHWFTGPARRTEYYNVTGPDVLWQRTYAFLDFATGALRFAASNRGFTGPGPEHSSAEREDWNEALLPAQLVAGPAMPQLPGVNFLCDGCRQGDRLRVRSLAAAGFGQYSDASDASHSFQGEPGTEETHLFSGSSEIAAQSDDLGLPYYTLPSVAGTYKVTDVFTDGFGSRHSATTVATTWTFRSARPATATVGAPYTCVDTVLTGDTQPCAWQPLIYLNYRLGLAPDDTVPAGHAFGFTIGTAKGSRIAGMRVWASSDRGAHWTSSIVEYGPDHSFRVLVKNPKSGATVSLKTEAWDATGNSVQQTITDAYLVK